MINTLSYRISFPSTGKVFSQNLVFEPGLTIIRGPNETGKSLILEMIRYALFGVSALRADRADYELLDVNMTFDVGDKAYRVSRTGNKAFFNGKEAVGTAAVNKKILEILGYDLDVFDIACAAMQGDLDKLTKRMRPGERRKMVEEVIGLTAIEGEEKICRTKGNALKKQYETEESKLVAPEPPEKPDNYESSNILEALYHTQMKVEAEREQLLRMKEPVPPEQPVRPEFSDDVGDYEQWRLRAEAERSTIERTLRTIPSATRTRQDVEQALWFYEQKALGPRTTHSKDDLLRWRDSWQTLGAVGTVVQCPRCHAEFDPKTATIIDLPEEPPISLREVNNELLAIERWNGYDKPIVESTDLSEEEAHEQLKAIDQEPLRNELLSSLGAIPDLPSRAEELEASRLYHRQRERYEARCESYERELKQWNEAQERLKKLGAEPDLKAWEARLKESRLYEEQLRRYEVDKNVYDKAQSDLADLKAKSEGYFKGAEALKDVRLEAKQHLVPSLSRVASHLLSEMTDGKRSCIEVDEEFEVVVDHQPVRTLSGSGISVVNLALRIALGQVLTQKITPIFLADEIDHDMDAERAAATHESLKKLTNMLDKVIVVTHKDIEGDHLIVLE
jgi:exonuclease SbcC